MNLEQLGQRIKAQREKRRLRQADIAAALRLSAQAVSKWERGENAPDISVLVDLSRLLGVSVEWLLGGTEAETDTFEATVFCTNQKGFSKMSRAMAPQDLAALAKGIYFTITEAVLRFDGVPIKYLGDGVLAFFSGGDHAARALQAAKAARAAFGNDELIVTLSSGEILFDSLGHPDYASKDILGQPVNQAFLVIGWVSENCKTGIGVTSSTAALLGDAETLVPRGEVTGYGLEKPVEIYEPK